jgi:hypothetical protein
MSLASDYAERCNAASIERAQITAEAPAPFVIASGRAEVTTSGELHFIQSVSGDFQASSDEALAYADWINATFR